jgi:hypothetical protein
MAERYCMNLFSLRRLTRFVQSIAAAELVFIVLALYHFVGYTDLQFEAVVLIVFAFAGFTVVFVPNIILNSIMLLAAIPVIICEVADWNSQLQGTDEKQDLLVLVTLYCGVGTLLSVGYLAYRLFRWIARKST